MNKAFIFDMDGVIIDDEENWVRFEKGFYPTLFGKEIAEKVGNTTGLGLEGIYEKAVSFGFKMDKEKFLKSWDNSAEEIYNNSPITAGIEDLAQFLINHNFKLGLVSASPLLWVNWVLARINFKDKLEIVISIHERPDLKHKPAPDGYKEAIERLGGIPETTTILEDSNTGIQSAKDAGAFVIGLKQNLIPGYVQNGADIYVNNVSEIKGILKA